MIGTLLVVKQARVRGREDFVYSLLLKNFISKGLKNEIYLFA